MREDCSLTGDLRSRICLTVKSLFCSFCILFRFANEICFGENRCPPLFLVLVSLAKRSKDRFLNVCDEQIILIGRYGIAQAELRYEMIFYMIIA